MAGKKRKAAKVAKVKKEEACCSENVGYAKLEAGMLLVIGIIWTMQALKLFAVGNFGGEFFQIIGSMVVLVIGAKKFIENSQSCC